MNQATSDCPVCRPGRLPFPVTFLHRSHSYARPLLAVGMAHVDVPATIVPELALGQLVGGEQVRGGPLALVDDFLGVVGDGGAGGAGPLLGAVIAEVDARGPRAADALAVDDVGQGGRGAGAFVRAEPPDPVFDVLLPGRRVVGRGAYSFLCFPKSRVSETGTLQVLTDSHGICTYAVLFDRYIAGIGAVGGGIGVVGGSSTSPLRGKDLCGS